ncbi:hypothetical protein [Sphingomonas astaxanthinifaciens]|uniref:DUF4440 domain-containing protein n=1 Tax=Sphingomonas astaxanthinifaciens DSM 22298 TaxID=1123267 RepID=A0ABQ5Z6Q9_9SPHN|nr:hypothetical protein [Sphingomonas astaxanthinifaciens]GLR46578.1 hypothetical protein GCM10007925_02890 [Sphingomonas astaxanthinifaciens DSM 22298]
MLGLGLLLAAATVPATAIEAERAFAADARREGQWTAFRKWADPTAVMFTPQAVWAQDYLKDRKDPATSVRWQASDSWVSCDRRTAVNTGPWQLPDANGYFVTLWMRQPSGDWRWTVDGGDTLRKPLAAPARPRLRVAACTNRAARLRAVSRDYANPTNRTAPPGDSGFARSADGTLLFHWTVTAAGARRTQVRLWNGRRFETVLDRQVAASPARS